ncbi:MAG: LysE family transporter [Albidovulum sp.]|nr:LysE family transporter [Albidovulum sp.]MDE0305277.1 LysE family transporter [Albidovulum sp.]MDE0531146.1 LysE family transporter [Albidovulum sp.]
MTLEQFLAFNAVLLAAIASPGPALLMAIQTSLSAGRTAGISIGAGLGLMAAAWTLMALLGLGVIFELFPVLYGGAKVIGTAYLLYVACSMWTNASVAVKPRIKPVGRAVRRGILVNLFNPKSVLFAAAVLVAIFPAGIDFADSMVIAANHFLVEIAFYTALALAMNTQAVANRYMRAKKFIDRGAAVVLGALGIRILFRADIAP